MDLTLRNARLLGGVSTEPPLDIGIEDGRIAAIGPKLGAAGKQLDLGGKLVAPSFVETHIHLDKSCILDRCDSSTGDRKNESAGTRIVTMSAAGTWRQQR